MGDWRTIYNNAVNQTLYAYNETRHTIDPDITSGLKQLRQTMIDNYTPNKILAQQEFRAICLKQLANITGVAAGNESGAGTQKQLKRIKARIPEIHSFLPIPDGPDDYDTIAYYPTFQGEMKANQDQQITPGSEVIVTFGNMTNFKDPRLIGVIGIKKGSDTPPDGDTSSANASTTGTRTKTAPKTPGALGAKDPITKPLTGYAKCTKYPTNDGPYGAYGFDKMINPLGLIPNRKVLDGGRTEAIYKYLDVKKTAYRYKRKAKEGETPIPHAMGGPSFWGTLEMQKFLIALDNVSGISGDLWSGGGSSPGEKTTWEVKDISPQIANGMIPWRGHASHRSGNDADIGLPTLGAKDASYGPNRTVGEPTETDMGAETGGSGGKWPLDLNRALVFLIIAQQNGASWVFLDKMFHTPLLEHAQKIMTSDPDGDFWKINPGWTTAAGQYAHQYKAFFTSNLTENMFNKIFGKNAADNPDSFAGKNGGKWKGAMIRHVPSHADHFHVRLGRAVQVPPTRTSYWNKLIAANCETTVAKKS